MRYIERIVLVAALVVALLAPAAASAAVRTVTINDGLDMQDTSPGLTPAPVVSELRSATVTYDDAAGTITAGVTFKTRRCGTSACRSARPALRTRTPSCRSTQTPTSRQAARSSGSPAPATCAAAILSR